MSFWSEVARILREPVVLRQPGLGVKFEAQLVRGRLQVRLANNVERTVDPAELRATWRLMDNGAGPDVIRLASANGPYLAAIRDYLQANGLTLGLDHDAAGDVTPLETALVTQAAAMSSVRGPIEADGATDPALEALSEQRDELVRENARLQSSVYELQEAAAQEAGRVAALSEELRRLQQSSQEAPTVGSRVEALPAYLRLLEPTIADGSLDDTVTSGLAAALRSIAGTPGLAMLECRKVLEQVVRISWRSTFDTDDLPAQTQFSGLMADLREQERIDMRRWNVAKTMYSVASEAAHVGAPPATAERALMLFLGVYELRSGLASRGR